jgi:hypothetical protein
VSGVHCFKNECLNCFKNECLFAVCFVVCLFACYFIVFERIQSKATVIALF